MMNDIKIKPDQSSRRLPMMDKVPVEICGALSAGLFRNLWFVSNTSSFGGDLQAQFVTPSLPGVFPESPYNLFLRIGNSNPELLTSNNMNVDRKDALPLIGALAQTYRDAGTNDPSGQAFFQFNVNLNQGDMFRILSAAPKVAGLMLHGAQIGRPVSIDFEHAAVVLGFESSHDGRPEFRDMPEIKNEDGPAIFSSTFYWDLKGGLKAIFLPEAIKTLHTICAAFSDGDEFTAQQVYSLYRKARVEFDPPRDRFGGWHPDHIKWLADAGLIARADWSDNFGRSYRLVDRKATLEILDYARIVNGKMVRVAAQRQVCAPSQPPAPVSPSIHYTTDFIETIDDKAIKYYPTLIFTLHFCNEMSQPFSMRDVSDLARKTRIDFYPKPRKTPRIYKHSLQTLVDIGLIEINGADGGYQIKDPERIARILNAARVDAEGQPLKVNLAEAPVLPVTQSAADGAEEPKVS